MDGIYKIQIIVYTGCKQGVLQGLVVGRWVPYDRILPINLMLNASFYVLASLKCGVGCRQFGPQKLGKEKRRQLKSTAVDQAVACAPVTLRVRVRSPVGTSSMGEVLFGIFPHLPDKCREVSGP